MDNNLSQLVEEAIKLELNVADLYLNFSNLFSKDFDFWWKLAIEEKNHAAILKSGRDAFIQLGLFPTQIVDTKLETLIQTNKELKLIIKEHKENPPTRESAFNLAIKLEESAGEVHFQHAMEKETDIPALKLFKKLNKDDKDHARRIREYMRKKGIDFIEYEKSETGGNRDQP